MGGDEGKVCVSVCERRGKQTRKKFSVNQKDKNG